jgi:hypothetical protein
MTMMPLRRARLVRVGSREMPQRRALAVLEGPPTSAEFEDQVAAFHLLD